MQIKAKDVKNKVNEFFKAKFPEYKKLKYNFQKTLINGFKINIFNIYYTDIYLLHFSLWFGHTIIDKLDFIINHNSDLNSNMYSDFIGQQIRISTGLLYEHLLYPNMDYFIQTIDDVENACNEFYLHFTKQWIPYVEGLNTMEKFEYEFNEGWYFQLKTAIIPTKPDIKIYLNEDYKIKGLILSKLVSEEKYKIRRDFYIIREIQDRQLYESPPSPTWQNFIAFLDNHTKDDLLDLVAEYDKKYLNSKKSSKKIKEKDLVDEIEEIKEEPDENTIPITGFDSDGEPEIRKEEDGSLTIAFNFMPPLNGQEEATEDPIFENFDKVMSEFLGVEVEWDDREFFSIKKPKEDTIEKIKDFLEHFWDKYYEQLSNPSKKKKRWWSF